MRSLSCSLVGVLLLFLVSSLPAQERQEKKQSKSFVGRVISSFFAAGQKTEAAPAVTVRATTPGVADIDEQSTHEQVALIKCVNDTDQTLQVNSFCLDDDGQLLAGCGAGPGEVRVYDADGTFIRSWEIPVKPESINTAADGVVLVAGEGKVFQFKSNGERIREADAPHVSSTRDNADDIRKQVEAQAAQRAQVYTNQITVYTQRIETLKKKAETQELSSADKQRLKAFERSLAQMEKMRDRYQGQQLSDAEIARQVKAMTDRKMRIASISTDGKSIYLTAPATVGYGFDVWKMDQQLSNGEKIVSGLRGCCGQMDVQACEHGIFVAENARHRVVSYDAEGAELLSFGKQDRKGVDGFTSCCNPMNLTFGPGGDIYTAESNTGRIKRFNQKGELVEYVGDVKLVPGCKNVSIAVSKDGARVYMLDITRNHIVVMKRKSIDENADDVAAVGTGS